MGNTEAVDRVHGLGLLSEKVRVGFVGLKNKFGSQIQLLRVHVLDEF
jgi:hypothetical protein